MHLSTPWRCTWQRITSFRCWRVPPEPLPDPGLLHEPRHDGPGVAVDVGDHPGRDVAAGLERRHRRPVDRIDIGRREHGAPAAGRSHGERDPAARVGGPPSGLSGPENPDSAMAGKPPTRSSPLSGVVFSRSGTVVRGRAAAELVGLDDRARRQTGGAGRQRADLAGEGRPARDRTRGAGRRVGRRRTERRAVVLPRRARPAGQHRLLTVDVGPQAGHVQHRQVAGPVGQQHRVATLDGEGHA